jgi:pimeloyl-ACP methyl ester carboxylesterase
VTLILNLMQGEKSFQSGYSDVSGLKMYYEIHGEGQPLVLIHGGGSTIETSFGHLIPRLSLNRQIIAVELQAHGRTNDRPADLTFEQDADDIAALLHNLGIQRADFLGFSNGGQTLVEIALRHSQLVKKLIIASAFYERDAAPSQFWDGFENASLSNMPEVLKETYLKVSENNQDGLLNMFKKDVQRMKTFKGWSDDQMRSIQPPVLIINGNHDVGSLEHAVKMKNVIPECELAVFPGGHGTYIGTMESINGNQLPEFNAVPLIEEFLSKN